MRCAAASGVVNRITPRRESGSSRNVLAALAVCALAGTASAQNLVQDCTFEAWGLFAAPWVVKVGTPTLHTNLLAAPNCPNVIGLAFQAGLEEIGQTSYMYYPDSQMYAMYAEVAGDRSVAGGPRTAAVRGKLTNNSGASHSGYVYPEVPALAGAANTDIQRSTWKPLVRRMPLSVPQGTNFTFDVRDEDDLGVLVDQVHLFPIRWDECTCPTVMNLAGYSINYDYTSAEMWPQPDLALRRSTASGCCPTDPCGGVPDTKGVWIWNKQCGNKTQEMLVAAWTFNDQTGVGPNTPTSLSLTIEAQSVQGKVGFTVQFYDWKLQRWVAPAAIGRFGCSYNNMVHQYPGGLLPAAPTCFTVNWTPYFCKLPSSCTNTPLGHYVSNPAPAADGAFFLPASAPANLVLARIIFVPYKPEWLMIASGPNPPPPNDWVAKVHYVGIDCH